MDEMDRSATGHDEEHGERMAVQAEIQDVLDELQREMAGDSVEDVTVAINRRLAAAGVPEQPARWVEGMAERISTGRVVVADSAAAVDAVRRSEAEPGSVEAEPESVEPGAVPESQATPPPADPR